MTSRAQSRAYQVRREVHLRAPDVVLVMGCWIALLALLGPARWAPGAERSALGFALLGLGPLVIRTLEASYPKNRLIAFLGAFWLLPVAGLGHDLLGPIVDTINPVLRDSQLALMDQHLFGMQVSVWLASVVPPWLTEILMFCYYGHFFWPVALGAVLYFTGRQDFFEEYILALALFFAFNYFCYALVPAVGPRFFLYDQFSAPLQGVWLTPSLDSLMRKVIFMRDCFPSGHTGVTLLVLVFSWRYERRFFWVMLLPGLGLIAATLVGRFHYATDLVCAVPLVTVTVALAMGVTRAAAKRDAIARPVRMDAIVRS